MSYIYKPLSIIAIFLGLLLISALSIGASLVEIFAHNYFLNVLIASIFFIGVGLCFIKLYMLSREYSWLDHFEKEDYHLPSSYQPVILLPLAMALKNQSVRSLNILGIKSILSSIDQRLENQREFNRYLVGLCVFLGLVGTFWGLSKTITAIASVINGIDINATDIKDAFHNLKVGLQSPLTGMGYAFSSSLFGLTASLALSFLDLQVSKSFSQFYNHVEESLSLVSKDTASSGSGVAYSSALIEQLAESMNGFQAQMDRSEESRFQTSKMMQGFLNGFNQLDGLLKNNLQMMEKLTHQQFELQQAFSLYIQGQQDSTMKDALKKIDANTHNILSEISQGRQKTTEELRQEIRLVSKTISALANGQDIA